MAASVVVLLSLPPVLATPLFPQERGQDTPVPVFPAAAEPSRSTWS
jgi:hypothetical protein